MYVSLCKDLAGPRGAVLAGDENFIAASRTWPHRLGCTVDEAWPFALDGMERASFAMPRVRGAREGRRARDHGTDTGHVSTVS